MITDVLFIFMFVQPPGTSDRNRDDELIQLLQADTNDETDPEKLWQVVDIRELSFRFDNVQSDFTRMIIPSRWIREWLLFAHFKLRDSPGKINMWSLLKEDAGTWRPKRNLKAPIIEDGAKGEEHPGHYR